VATEFFQQAFAHGLHEMRRKPGVPPRSSAPLRLAGHLRCRVSIITMTDSTWLRINTGHPRGRQRRWIRARRRLDGFFVVSNHADGSGSANTSILNSGVGQDGVVGQTYRDLGDWA
jgi:hypothetical protein